MKTRPTALRSARERNGHTHTSLAAKAGVSKQRISQLEAGVDLGILPTTAKRLADALGVEITEIAELTDATEEVAG